jgi:hypothetical protein
VPIGAGERPRALLLRRLSLKGSIRVDCPGSRQAAAPQATPSVSASGPTPPMARSPANNASPAPTVLRGTIARVSAWTAPLSSTSTAPSGPSETRTVRTP